MKARWLDINGDDCSLIISFIASAKGCGKPIIEGLLGPFRNCA